MGLTHLFKLSMLIRRYSSEEIVSCASKCYVSGSFAGIASF